MHEHLSPDRIENFWRRLFPGQIPDRLLVAEPLGDELAQCSNSIQTASIRARFGAQPTPPRIRHRFVPPSSACIKSEILSRALSEVF
jgi:hypothetical protein